MTPTVLLDALKAFIENKTEDMLLPVRPARNTPNGAATERAAEVYKMQLPTKDDQTRRIPYVLLQFLKMDIAKGKSTADVRIVGATYCEDAEEGSLAILNLLTRIQNHILKAGLVADQFEIMEPMEMIVYPDNTAPYYLGEIMTKWSLPTVQREERLYGN